MIKFKSINEWKKYCFNTHKSYIKNKYFRCWIKKKNINIFNYTALREGDVIEIRRVIENALKICNNNFKIKLFKRKFRELNFAVKDGSIAGRKILEMVKKSRIREKSCDAEIFLVNRKAKSGEVLLKYGDALTYVSDGIAVFTFDPLIVYPKKFFRSAIAHEVYHLLGLNIHHNDTEIEEYGKSAKCVMGHNAPSGHLCRKCKDALTSFWKGIEYATKE